MEEKTALIAMSGGVDSSVAAELMARAGFRCIGCTMRLYENDLIGKSLFDSCCSLKDTEDARAVAEKIGIPYYIFHHETEFQKKVVEPFIESYERGFTPNPCIDCNRYLKFDSLYARAEAYGCRCLATGHYARIEARGGHFYLLKAKDRTKDQSYVLFRMTEEQLSRTCFPLGTYTKAEVRKIAENRGFATSRKKESQDICFVPSGKYADMIRRFRRREYPPGPIMDTNGVILGTHQGLIGYTIGQRRGLGVAAGRRLYVCALDVERNAVIVSDERGLYRRNLLLRDFHWISGERPSGEIRCAVKIRYRQAEQPAVTAILDRGMARVVFDEPQRAPAPGQSAVLYDGDVVLGGGVITSESGDFPSADAIP